jgi:hypothetical protein
MTNAPLRRKIAPPDTEPHVADINISTMALCNTCGYAFAPSPTLDPAHWVARGCTTCGTMLPSPWYRFGRCDGCQARIEHEREVYRARRLASLDFNTRPGFSPDGEDGPAEREPGQGGTGKRGPKPDMPRYREVEDYLRAYRGQFPFLLDMQRIILGTSKYDRLTLGQYGAVVKCIDRDKERPAPVQTGITFDNLPFGRYGFAVQNESGNLSFFRIDKLQTGKWEGFVFVKHELGGTTDDTMRRVGMVKPGQSYVGQWPELMRKIEADPMAAAQLYGQSLGKCGDCQRTLTNDESRAYGIGPVCRSKLGA